MKAGAGLSFAPDARGAVAEAVGEARTGLGDADPTFAILSASRHHVLSAEVVSEALRVEGGPERVLGCVAETVVAGDREVERGPAVAVWLAALPEPVETFHMEFVRTSEAGVFGGYRFDHGRSDPHLLVADPFSFPADLLLAHLNERVPGAIVMGGMSSGATGPGEARLFLDDRVLRAGAVGVRLPGIHLRPLVSQGCRPIGKPFTVTRAEGNLVLELGGRTPLQRIQELVAASSAHDLELMSQGLHVGRLIDEYAADPGRGDFLVRGVLGLDRETGAIAVGEMIEVGWTIQFHVRDADTADEDLRELLALESQSADGALLFTCNGRGTRLFPEPNHDAALVSERLGDAPLAGFNCAGEIGPVGGKNFLHGFTASVAWLSDA
ncbi:MAG TPA: FIST N-terminal domain-containing protein [Actinomycetota bacterium]|nr:FIST N-terminal domain-containing protein [Actinomycetota bacterium]